MEKLTNNIAEKISLELGFDNDRKVVIAYGVFALLHTIVSLVLVVIFGLIFGVLIESLMISIAVSILRKYSGGVHASSPAICDVIGIGIIVGEAVLIYYIIAPVVNAKLIIVLGLLTFAWSYSVICKLAPVDSIAKPIKTHKKKERMKKVSLLVLDAYVLIVLINIIMYLLTYNKRFLVFAVCIYGSTAWQAFTLTSAGHLIIRKIDAFLNQILIYKRRRK